MIRSVVLAAVCIALALAHGGGSPWVPHNWLDLNIHDDTFIRHAHRVEAIANRMAPSTAMAPRINLKGLPAPSFECDICMDVAPILINAIGNTTDNEKLVALLHKICMEKYKGKQPDTGVCDGIADIVLGAGEILVDEFERFNFNLSVLVCADVAKKCKVPCCETEGRPEQVHLSFANGGNVVGDNVPIRVAWATLKPQPNPYVQWRIAGTSEWEFKSNASVSTYTQAGWIGSLYNTILTELHQNKSYEYRVGSDVGGFSDVFTFKTLPTNLGTPERPMKILTLADMGFSHNSTMTVKRMTDLVLADEVDFIVHTGDISYADGDQFRWDAYMRKMQPILSRVPYMTGPGNHEAFYNFTAYKKRLVTPIPGDGAPSDAMFYQFYAGNVMFLMLDSETPYQLPRMDPEQVAWAEKQMQFAYDHNMMIFAGFHRPMYCSNGHSADCGIFAEFFREKLEALFVKYRVAIVHVGHMHDYERTLPVLNGKATSTNYTNPPSPFTMVNGAGGCIEGPSSFRPEKPDWSVFRSDDWGFVKMTLQTSHDGEKSLESFFVNSDSNVVLDTVHLTQTKN